MKIILLKPYLVAKSNGGEISMLERLAVLKSWGAEIQIHIALPAVSRSETLAILEEMGTPMQRDDTYQVNGLKCEVKFSENFHPFNLSSQVQMETHFGNILKQEKPDYVWAHYTDFFAVTSAIRWDENRSWIVVTDNEFPKQMELNQFPTVAACYLSIKTIVVASKFMQQSIRSALPWTKPLRIPNPVVTFESNGESLRDPKGAWIFVNPTQVKGLEFMTELVQALPDEKFIFVGNWATEMPEDLPQNVESLPRQNGLRNVFKRAKGVLMPSVWQEAFGRLALEAMAAGVPLIASDRGSLPETVGGGGICLPLELPLWTKALTENSEEFWKEVVTRGFQRTAEYQAETQHRFRALRRSLSGSPKGLVE